MTKFKDEKELLNSLIPIAKKGLERCSTNLKTPWMILFNGSPLRLRSDRSTWSSRGAAITSLHNHLRYVLPFNAEDKAAYPNYRLHLGRLLIEKGIVEIVPVVELRIKK